MTDCADGDELVDRGSCVGEQGATPGATMKSNGQVVEKGRSSRSTLGECATKRIWCVWVKKKDVATDRCATVYSTVTRVVTSVTSQTWERNRTTVTYLHRMPRNASITLLSDNNILFYTYRYLV